ncbi:MAG: SpoIIE family protein phosphatase [Clostridiaceae bacterium]|nr:SpoIIE family protein phosphatase [Clostridiaceae bacterium]
MNSTKAGSSVSDVKERYFSIFITLLLTLLLFLIVELSDNSFISRILVENNIWHRILDVYLLIVSFSIFFISFHTYPQTKDNRLLIIGFTFLIGGILYWIQILDIPSYLGAGYGISSPRCTFLLCLTIRIINGICFGLIATIRFKNKHYIKRRYMWLSIIVVFVTYYIISSPLIKQEYLINNHGLTALSVSLLTFTGFLYIYVLYFTLKEYLKTNEFVFKILCCAFILMFFSGISLMGMDEIFDINSALSHFYLVVSYGIFFYAFYIESIKKPYVQLAKAKEDLDEYIEEMDKLVDRRTIELRGMYEKLMADQEIARGIQLSMLPSEFPENEFVSFSAGYVPAEKLSGDFYNVFKIDDSRFGICIGDVSGHGVSAAMLSIFTFQKIQSLMEESADGGVSIPSVVLTHLYESFNSANFNDDMYIVMIYGVFNTQTGILSYASGGLNTSPLRIRPDGSVQELDSEGFAICKLGDFIKPKFANRQVLLFPGDKLLLYTDGLIEARNSSNDEYSIKRLKSVIKKYNRWGIDYLTEAIINDVKEFIGDEKLTDDITLLSMDVLPPF